MTTYRDDFFEDSVAEFSDSASPAVYRPRAAGEAAGFPAAQGGAAVETLAVVENRQTEAESRAQMEVAEIRIPARDVASPQIDDVIVVDGEEWQHRPSTDQSIQRRRLGPFWILRCRREVRATVGGGGR
ncbi:hypothetical protein G3N56_07855 [Desulfovibrio sulfodismutans]|uniref:Uncharacterized protein n=1 Tax=Desulfolutivibrio sulfodismutans TaxID=63561 RepID=A0A7K3NKC7_9BACT|nr:hypothetical protein [Desulfolutivibrio sulfodismutans]NDY56656.1 hypothetical protein [Desulfolutivibrio sulfodismutans]QLA11244.1 hypothetical protein GD606_02605 [Desulfolutivibrio sulfodismutans DSM 3696]